MKKTIAIIVSVLFVLSVAGVAFAAEQKELKGEPGAAGPVMEKHMKVMHVTGTVTAVDVKAKTLTIKGEKGEVVLTTTDKTIHPRGKTLADVKVGDKLTTMYEEKGGKMIALKVMKEEHKQKEKK
jgi:Cu/Ag efflux protein CusF